MLQEVDRRSVVGKRDYAILLLLAGVYKIKGGKEGKCRSSSGLRVVGLYVLTGLAQRGIGA